MVTGPSRRAWQKKSMKTELSWTAESAVKIAEKWKRLHEHRQWLRWFGGQPHERIHKLRRSSHHVFRWQSAKRESPWYVGVFVAFPGATYSCSYLTGPVRCRSDIGLRIGQRANHCDVPGEQLATGSESLHLVVYHLDVWDHLGALWPQGLQQTLLKYEPPGHSIAGVLGMQTRSCRPRASTSTPQRQVWGAPRFKPSRSDTATRTASSSSLSQHDATEVPAANHRYEVRRLPFLAIPA